jgi:hypothetical protein
MPSRSSHPVLAPGEAWSRPSSLGALWTVLGQISFREFSLFMPRTYASTAVSTVGRNRSKLTQDQLPFLSLLESWQSSRVLF